MKDPMVGGNVSYFRKGKEGPGIKKLLFEKTVWKEKNTDYLGF